MESLLVFRLIYYKFEHFQQYYGITKESYNEVVNNFEYDLDDCDDFTFYDVWGCSKNFANEMLNHIKLYKADPQTIADEIPSLNLKIICRDKIKELVKLCLKDINNK